MKFFKIIMLFLSLASIANTSPFIEVFKNGDTTRHTIDGVVVRVQGTSIFANNILLWVDGYPYVEGDGELIPFLIPDLAVMEPTNYYPITFTEFDTTGIISASSPDANSPLVSDYTRSAVGGDIITLTGENLNGYEAMVYDGNILTNAMVMFEDSPLNQGAVILPEVLSDSCYMVSLTNVNGAGEAFMLNTADIFWLGFSRVIQGETFSVYGRNLSLNGGSCWIYITGYGWLESYNENPYKADFICPALPVGDYTVYAHNGHGEKYGWSDGKQLTVWEGSNFSENSADWINVITEGGLLNDGTGNNNPALKNLIIANSAEQWPTFYFPDGVYKFTATSSGEKLSINQFSTGFRFIGQSTNAVMLFGEANKYYSIWEIKENNSIFTNFTIKVLTSTYNDSPILVNTVDGFTMANMFVDSSEVHTRRPPFSDRITKNFTIKDCEMQVSSHLVFQENIGTKIVGSRFWGMMETGSILGIGGNNTMIEDCIFEHLDNTDHTSARNWWQGRVTVANDWGQIGLYYGGNVTIDASTHLDYDPFVTDRPLAFTDLVYNPTINKYTMNIIMPTNNLREYIYGSYGAELWISTSYDGTHKDDGMGVESYNPETGLVGVEFNPWNHPNPGNTNSVPNTNCLVSIRDTSHWNSGEQILREGGNVKRWRLVSSATTNSVTYQGSDIAYGGTSIGYHAVVIISKGKGIGQFRAVTSIQGDTIYIDEPWRVIPDTTSEILIGNASLNTIIYDNIFDAQEYPSDLTASAAVQFTHAASGNCIIDGNTFVDLGSDITFERNPVRLDNGLGTTNDHYGIVSNMIIENNVSSNCFKHYTHYHKYSTTVGDNPSEQHFYGIIIRNDTAYNIKEKAFSLDAVSPIRTAYIGTSFVMQDISWRYSGVHGLDPFNYFKNIVSNNVSINED